MGKKSWLLCLFRSIWHCDHLVGEEGADYFGFLGLSGTVITSLGKKELVTLLVQVYLAL